MLETLVSVPLTPKDEEDQPEIPEINESFWQAIQDHLDRQPEPTLEDIKDTADLRQTEADVWSRLEQMDNLTIYLAQVREATTGSSDPAVPFISFSLPETIALSRQLRQGEAARSRLQTLSPAKVAQEYEQLDALFRQGLTARKRLIEKNLRLPLLVAFHYVSAPLEIEDSIQIGNMGLIKAVEKYNPELGYEFSNYALYWIRAAVSRAVIYASKNVRPSIRLYERIRKITVFSAAFEDQYHQLPSRDQIAAGTGLKEKFVDQALKRQETISTVFLEDMAPRKDTLHWEEHVASADDSEEVLYERCERQQQIWEILETVLTPDELHVLIVRMGLKNGDKKTLEATGTYRGVSKERVRQIQETAFTKLRQNKTLQQLFAELPLTDRPIPPPRQYPAAPSPLLEQPVTLISPPAFREGNTTLFQSRRDTLSLLAPEAPVVKKQPKQLKKPAAKISFSDLAYEGLAR